MENLDLVALRFLRQALKKARFDNPSGEQVMALARSFLVMEEVIAGMEKPKAPPVPVAPAPPAPVEKKAKKR